MVVILMGVSGSGKTTVGELLAEQLGWQFYDADDFHPEENVEKMRSGEALSDIDREPWLHALSELIKNEHENNRNIVLACSALRKKYREILDQDLSPIRLVYLKGDFELIQERLSKRTGHYMDPALLKSQFDTLEIPSTKEGALFVDISPAPDEIVNAVCNALGIALSPDQPGA